RRNVLSGALHRTTHPPSDPRRRAQPPTGGTRRLRPSHHRPRRRRPKVTTRANGVMSRPQAHPGPTTVEPAPVGHPRKGPNTMDERSFFNRRSCAAALAVTLVIGIAALIAGSLASAEPSRKPDRN